MMLEPSPQRKSERSSFDAAQALALAYVDDAQCGNQQHLRHPQYAITFVERGACRIEIDGGDACLVMSEAALITPNLLYTQIVQPDSVVWFVRFDASAVDVSLPLTGTRMRRLSHEHRDSVPAVLRLLNETRDTDSAYRKLVRRMHFTAVVACMLGGADLRDVLLPGRNPLVQATLEVIDQRFAERIGPAEIARDLGRHPAYLTNLVRESTGKSIGTLLIERRLEAARLLLTTTHLPIVDIALAVGYVDVSHFARHFARLYGDPPARWRRRRSN